MTKKSAVVLLVLGWFLLCKPWFFDHRVVPWDSKDQFYPFAHFVSESIRSGESPFWNPYSAAGSLGPEVLADVKFSPFSLLVALCGGSSLAFHAVALTLFAISIAFLSPSIPTKP